MNTEPNIYNWKFKLTVDPTEALTQLQSPLNKNPAVFKHALRALGVILDEGCDRLEKHAFFNQNDGQLIVGNSSGAQIREVEIDILEPENVLGLKLLNTLRGVRFETGTMAHEGFKDLVSQFRMHGHEKDKPAIIHALGYDEKGFFLADMRKSLETVKILEEHPLP